MNRHKKKTVIVVVIFTILAMTNTIQAQYYAIDWWTTAGGGGSSSGSGYNLSVTIGQPDAGVMTGGSYKLAGGFWSQDLMCMVYLPLILKQ